ncbi:uncharacterized protein LOC144308672 [Canis aureus]
MIENPPPWLKPFLPPKAEPTEILALRKAEKETDSLPEAPLRPVFQDSSPEDLILPLPYWVSPPTSAPPLEALGAAEGAPGSPCERDSSGDTRWDPPDSPTSECGAGRLQRPSSLCHGAPR